jgi:beta-N-acetylhexosaminidase
LSILHLILTIQLKERAFSADPDSVALFAAEFMKQHRKMNIVTSLKHFPGHGSSKDDTHLGIADVTNTWNEKELIPYQRLIESGQIDAIMTAHIVNKKLDDKGLPGTLSKKITTELLRDKLHFNGVVFSDDMQMHAITKHYSFEDAILLAINGGVDILMFSNNIAGSQERTSDKVHQIIRRFVENGTISKERIDQSFQRIMTLKQRLTLSREEYYRSELIKSKNNELKALEIAKKNAELAKHQVIEMNKKEAEVGKKQSKKEKKKKKG